MEAGENTNNADSVPPPPPEREDEYGLWRNDFGEPAAPQKKCPQRRSKHRPIAWLKERGRVGTQRGRVAAGWHWVEEGV